MLVAGYAVQIARLYGLLMCFHTAAQKFPRLVQHTDTPPPARNCLFSLCTFTALASTFYIIYQFCLEDHTLVEQLTVTLVFVLSCAFDTVASFLIGLAAAVFQQDSESQLLSVSGTRTAGAFGKTLLERFERLRFFLSPILFIFIMTNAIGMLKIELRITQCSTYISDYGSRNPSRSFSKSQGSVCLRSVCRLVGPS